ncbi:MAG: prepilin-type N-terminal cleavage/methylation domain-containing protein [Thermodesulfobacteriota bacterium]|nr:prepilin-type N-terminal cleavage/methylation domain-containing protein [Thermodesulfobacteriota bacterium]
MLVPMGYECIFYRKAVFRQSPGGFTLIELMIVMAIIAITFGYIGPNFFGGLFASSMDRAVRDISNTIQFARSSAITQHQEYRVHFDLDESIVGICLPQKVSGEQPEMLMERKLPQGVRIKGIKTCYQNAVHEGTMDFKVTGEGIVELGIIYLEGGMDRVYTLEIKPFSGRFRVYDHYVEKVFG